MSVQRVPICQDSEPLQRQTVFLAREATCAQGTLVGLHRQVQSLQTPAPQANTVSQALKATMSPAPDRTPAQLSALQATIAQPRLLPRFLANTATTLVQTVRLFVSNAHQVLYVTTLDSVLQILVTQDMFALRDLPSWRPVNKVTRLSPQASQIALL